jgi:hypothetical protein
MGEESKRRIRALEIQLDMKEICWVLMLLTLTTINQIPMDRDQGGEFKERTQAERTLH